MIELVGVARQSTTPTHHRRAWRRPTERAVLLVLMAESRPVPNPDLVALGPKLDKPGRDKLNEVGLIESHRSDGRFVHELTDRGWRLCRDILSADPAAVDRSSKNAVYGARLFGIGTYAAQTSASPTCSGHEGPTDLFARHPPITDVDEPADPVTCQPGTLAERMLVGPLAHNH